MKACKENRSVTSLPVQKRGRPYLLGDKLDKLLQMYIRKIRDGGGSVSTRIVVAAARGLLLSYDKIKLEEFGGSLRLNRHWAYSLLRRMKFVRRKGTTSKSKYSDVNFSALKKSFLDNVVTTVLMEEIPGELIMNWDQTGINLVPASSYTMEQCGSKCVEMGGAGDKRQITAVFCGTILGDFLPVQLIYKGKTPRCHPKYKFPPDWSITHSPKRWSNENTMLEYIDDIVIPYVEKTRELIGESSPALVIIDNFKGQVTETIFGRLEEYNIHTCRLPANTTDQLQPMDLSVNKAAKDFLRDRFQKWYAEQITEQLEGENEEDIEAVELEPIPLPISVVKEVEAKWMVEMFEYFQNNPQIIVNGFLRSGISAALDNESIESEEEGGDDSEKSSGDESSGDDSEIESSGDDSEIESSGDDSEIESSGDE